ncbi:hypothetical protein WA026_010298 [Henosepilachna vigintioctopunctata]|uniref:Uncharacterized protein n=1 Tax=Henosepilachna vigintioctopunctata TaxID=420089 RepID=A0AAW1UD01_9CUCU
MCSIPAVHTCVPRQRLGRGCQACTLRPRCVHAVSRRPLLNRGVQACPVTVFFRLLEKQLLIFLRFIMEFQFDTELFIDLITNNPCMNRNTTNARRTKKLEQTSVNEWERMIEEGLVEFMKQPPREPTSETKETDDEKVFFDSLIPAIKTFSVDNKLAFRCEPLAVQTTATSQGYQQFHAGNPAPADSSVAASPSYGHCSLRNSESCFSSASTRSSTAPPFS